MINPWARRNRGPWRLRPFVVVDPVRTSAGLIDLGASPDRVRRVLTQEVYGGLLLRLTLRASTRRALVEQGVTFSLESWAQLNDESA